ncbi:MAG: YybS family protein [Deltaproteobacteria bacterium]|nr:YybS family protein [Deltaproteobacteria bacterium]
MAQAIDIGVSFLLLLSAMTTPSSIVLLETRRGRWAAWGTLLFFGALCFLLGGPGFAAWILAVFVAAGPGLAAGFRRSEKPDAIFGAGLGTALVSMAAVGAVAVVGGAFDPDAARAVFRAFEANKNALIDGYGLVSGAETMQVRERAGRMLSLAFLLVPSINVALAAITVWLNMLIVIRFGPEGRPYRGMTELWRWSAPEPLVFGVLAPAIFLIFSPGLLATAVAGNVLVICLLPFFFQGMAVTSNALRKMRFGPGMRVVSYGLLVGMLGVMVVPAQASLGVLDIWLDFRRLRRPPSDDGDAARDEGQGDEP